MIFKRIISGVLCMSVGFGVLAVNAYAEETTENEKTYAVICESGSSPFKISASDVNVEGLVYSNYAIEAPCKIENQKDNYEHEYYVTNFSSQLMSFEGEVINHENEYIYAGYINEVSSFGLSDMAAACYKLSIGEIFGANDNVTINAAIVDCLAENEKSIIFSSNGNISINVDTLDFDGVIYAPNGSVTINANNVDVCGLIIAQDVEINCSSCTITSSPEVLGQYDIKFYTLSDTAAEIDIMEAKGSGLSDRWYFNTGTEIVTRASYSKYKLLSTVKTGDIIHEKRDLSIFDRNSMVGHIAYVEGVYYRPLYSSSSSTYKYNIRVIEAMNPKVFRSVLDDTRCYENNTILLRYKGGLSSAQVSKITYFMQKQIGKKYACDASRDESINAKEWYCSELVWAAFKYVGLDIEDGNFGAITPGDVLDSSNTKIISYK